jgi:hypothetical protein
LLLSPLLRNFLFLSRGKGSLLANAGLAGTVQLWEWIGDQGAATFSY